MPLRGILWRFWDAGLGFLSCHGLELSVFARVSRLGVGRGGRVVEGARLESVYTPKGIKGSNPFLSTSFGGSLALHPVSPSILEVLMKMMHLGLAAAMVAAVLSGCASLGGGGDTVKGTAIGTVAGAALGAAWGAARGNWAEGAAIGAGVGAVAGGVTGVVMDRQAEALRKAGIASQRDAAGNLVVSLTGDSLKFETGKFVISSEGEATLTRLAGVIKQYPENRINISGHTDNVGNSAANVTLSQNRSDSVKAYLLGQGVPTRCIISSMGYGDQHPVADNRTAEGRAANRRVELGITVDQDEAKSNEAAREKYQGQ
jgi:outer membrane protein OmpA-like peptidoglycan-associated protein